MTPEAKPALLGTPLGPAPPPFYIEICPVPLSPRWFGRSYSVLQTISKTMASAPQPLESDPQVDFYVLLGVSLFSRACFAVWSNQETEISPHSGAKRLNFFITAGRREALLLERSEPGIHISHAIDGHAIDGPVCRNTKLFLAVPFNLCYAGSSTESGDSSNEP